MNEPKPTTEALWEALERICQANAEGRTERYQELKRLLQEAADS